MKKIMFVLALALSSFANAQLATIGHGFQRLVGVDPSSDPDVHDCTKKNDPNAPKNSGIFEVCFKRFFLTNADKEVVTQHFTDQRSLKILPNETRSPGNVDWISVYVLSPDGKNPSKIIRDYIRTYVVSRPDTIQRTQMLETARTAVENKQACEAVKRIDSSAVCTLPTANAPAPAAGATAAVVTPSVTAPAPTAVSQGRRQLPRR